MHWNGGRWPSRAPSLRAATVSLTPCASFNGISLGDIQNLPTFWVFALFGTFYNFCFRVQTCRHLGGGMCILFEICKKTPFHKCMGFGGRG